MKIFIRSYKSRRDGSEGNKPNFHALKTFLYQHSLMILLILVKD